jgi:hypothetical protein
MEHREEKAAQCVTVVVLVDCLFLVSQNEKGTDSKGLNEREREREREKREKGKEKEMEEIRLELKTMSRYVSVYVTCLKQAASVFDEV